MLNLLINVGRRSILAAATLTVLGCTGFGWACGMSWDRMRFAYEQVGAVTPARLAFAALGLSVGVTLAGSIFGLAAAIFDMQLSLQKLAGANKLADAANQLLREKIEPRF